jgi:glycosyltransferase involved in cell wall biosynthesis
MSNHEVSLPAGGDVRVDLHVHSQFSDKPYSWLLRATKSAECYTTPRRVHEVATRRGMNLVTISDHDTIDGALELCALASNTFISEEISARFPEDGCVVHTIAVDINEAQHVEVQRLRRNIYELVTYLDQQHIEFFLCHALSQVNRRLTPGHLQRCLLMFRNLELRNGTRDPAHEAALLRIVRGLDAATLARWAEQHPQAPVLAAAGGYAFVGGSDDHAGLSIARAFTRFEGPCSGAGVTRALRAGATVPDGSAATHEVLSHNVYGVTAGVLLRSGQLGAALAGARTGDERDDGAGHERGAGAGAGAGAAAAGPGGDGEAAPSAALGRALQRFAVALGGAAIDLDWDHITCQGHTDAVQARMHAAMETVLVRIGRDALSAFTDAVRAVRPAELAESLPGILNALILGAPYLAGGRWSAHDRKGARRFAEALGFPLAARRGPRVLVVSDTTDDVNGVALGLRRLAQRARREGLDLRLCGVGPGEHVTVDDDGIVRIPSMMNLPLPEYPQLTLGLPHLPSLLGYVIKEEIDLVQCSTPGPVGLAGLVAGRLAGVPVIGQFHTDVPEYAARLTGDPVVAAIVGRYVGWFYGLVDEVLAPSLAVAERLAALGVPASKVRRIPRGIDLDLFSPARRNEHAFESFGLNGEPKVLYVGRLSREKGLDELVAGFRGLADDIPTAKLLLIGDGPYGAELRRESIGDLGGRVIFTGEVIGERLAEMLASSDIFVYPSETETFGNAIVEAQAAGVPVIVASRGAASENVIDGVTGLVVDARNPAEICAAMRVLLGDPARRKQMGARAAEFAQRYDAGAAARASFELYGRILDRRGEAAAA